MSILKKLLQGGQSFIARKRFAKRTKLPRGISDKTARDIGLDANTLAQLRHQWPSERPAQEHLKTLVSRNPRR